MTEPDSDTYALKSVEAAQVVAPDLLYLPPRPAAYRPRIGLIGAGGISPAHLDAYRAAGFTVAAICNRTLGKAQQRAAEFAPLAHTTSDPSDILSDPSIDVIDITLHPGERLPLIEAALRAGKHVLSQKPFVLDLDDGERLADLADARGLFLAVNQNGRWAPHMAWMRAAVQAGHIGDLQSVHTSLHWDHSWVADTPFDQIDDLILHDFGIHWFDFIASLVPGRARSVFATATKGVGQTARSPLMAQALIELDSGQASAVFDGTTRFGPRDTTFVTGTMGSLHSDGPDLGQQRVTLTTAQGRASPDLRGTWFNDGFAGAMGALLVAIESGTEPENGARENLDSLALGFAAIESRRIGRPVKVGSIRRVIV